MHLEWPRSFMEAARPKSFSKASESRQLALSKHIQKLEEFCGATLFDRLSTGVRLTEAGAILYSRREPVLREMEAVH